MPAGDLVVDRDCIDSKRRVIERTFAWACINRLLARDVEGAATAVRALFQIAMLASA